MRTTIAIVSIAMLALAPSFAGDAKACTDSEAQSAEQALDQLSNWGDFQLAFQTFGHCDDGAIAEGYSDFAMRMLARNWDEVPTLAKLARSNEAFGEFVLSHIDETWIDTEFELVRQNAERHCPVEARTMCVGILKRMSKITTRDSERK